MTSSSDEDIKQLHERRNIWATKYPIRACYANWSRMLSEFVAKDQKNLEIGAGSGFLKEIFPYPIVATDILRTPWIDFTLDALDLAKLGDKEFDNVIGIDCLHHFDHPHEFLKSLDRVTKDSGQVLLLEPWISPVSYIFYRFMHHEDVYFKSFVRKGHENQPWYGNLAMANLVFDRHEWSRIHDQWEIEYFKKFSFFDFQVAGGFKKWALVRNKRVYDFLLFLDKVLAKTPLISLIAFRVVVVLKKKSGPQLP